MKTSELDYYLPDELIAKYPANPKNSAKLLVYKRSSGEIIHSSIANIKEYLPNGVSLIFNDTKVLKARFFGHKPSGAKHEILYLSPKANNTHTVMIRGKVKQNTQINLQDNINIIVKTLLNDGSRDVVFVKNGKELGFATVCDYMQCFGHLPLPPYMARDANNQDELDYQTCFAKNMGSVAAPTASLHFNQDDFASLKKDFQHAFVTLHVGAGTFKPIEADTIYEHKMHFESFEISSEALDVIKSQTKILTFGTTACRAIESYVRGINGQTNLFLHPNNVPQRVDYLLTNFHLPKSTLLALVASFVGLKKTLEIYEIAVKNRYRFYSYGDAMLII